ncbi:MAG: adenosylcobinamide-GDP ribazoletransferase [Nitrospirae bacterium]|nr:adenosylcobinamide-GDP ribazoletransferase [Nitrospirota bacterium]
MSNKSRVKSLKEEKSLTTNYSSFITRFFLAYQFLTIVPLRVSGEISEKEIGRTPIFFPLVGVFQGISLVAAGVILRKIFSLELTNGLLILLLVLINGSFHLDGLADTFDAIASRGNIEKKLSIMKDSTIGPAGVVAIVFALLLKFLALNSLSLLPHPIFYSAVFLMPILSKWTMVISMLHGKPARQDGLGKIFMKSINIRSVILSTFLMILLFVLIVAIHIIFNKVIPINPTFTKGRVGGLLLFLIVLLALLYLLSLLLVRFFDKSFGGLTGDTLGAISEITELAFLLIIIWFKSIV